MATPQGYNTVRLHKGEDISDIKECPNCHGDSIKLRFWENGKGGTCDNCGRSFVIYRRKEPKPQPVNPFSAEQVQRLMAGEPYASVTNLDPKDQSAVLVEMETKDAKH